ncbi:MAG: hypothetical protein Q7T93_06020 [Methylobacterium sp.]|uniref:hypothetical protein n=1 Tax=Methylobacterium sp. TaxID=409 RepID=UPI002715D456|nr:hypothetical protein [Methylobacterium sp.]MDO9426371.1 hypothetical protein [Methylobacterium sp.]
MTPACAVWLAGAALAAMPAAAAPVAGETVAKEIVAKEIVAREILALYDGAQEQAPDRTRIHKYAEVVLNHLGYAVVYRDVRDPLPEPGAVARYAGILTWFAAPPAARGPYLAWARIAARSARRVVILGSTGGAFWSDDHPAINAVLSELGLRHERRAIELTLGTEAVPVSKRLTAFERGLDPVLPTYDVVTAMRSDVEPWLHLTIPRREGGGTSVVVATGPRGGYAASGFEIVEDGGLGRSRWLIDPFAFFARALRSEPWPIPDVTTVSGRRLYFHHVDSDGLNDVIVARKQEPVLVPQVFLNEIVLAYPDLPVTLAVTPGDLDPLLGGNATPTDLVRQIWSSPNVEAGVASYTRPHRWAFFAEANRAAETAAVTADAPQDRFGLRRLLDLAGYGTAIDSHVAGGRDLPREYFRFPFDLRIETETALATARTLLPADKSIRLYQWTGDAQPFEGAIAATRRLGLLNINGGESRLDPGYPSVSHLAPIARPVGIERQTYAVASDELPRSKAWRPMVAALRGLRTTALNTEIPRRLKGSSLHYHLASLAKQPALREVQAHLAEARTAPVAPITAADYAELAQDFPGVAIDVLGDGAWSVAGRGAVQTVRFDAAGAIDVDLSRSIGVIGRTRHGDALYVALDRAVEPARVVLWTGAGPAPAVVSLADARWRLWQVVRSGADWRYEASGFGPGDFAWDGVPAGAYRVIARRNGEDLWSAEVAPSVDGRLSFSIPVAGIAPLGVEIRRVATAEATR